MAFSKQASAKCHSWRQLQSPTKVHGNRFLLFGGVWQNSARACGMGNTIAAISGKI